MTELIDAPTEEYRYNNYVDQRQQAVVCPYNMFTSHVRCLLQIVQRMLKHVLGTAFDTQVTHNCACSYVWSYDTLKYRSDHKLQTAC